MVGAAHELCLAETPEETDAPVLAKETARIAAERARTRRLMTHQRALSDVHVVGRDSGRSRKAGPCRET